MTEPLLDVAGAERATATLSDDGVYRYRLDRIWDPDAPRALFIMLNPSTADATTDDPTIRRCRTFAHREQLGGFTVVNLYALRSPDPAALLDHPDPVGPDCDHHLLQAMRHPHVAIAAWGAHPFAERRAEYVARLVVNATNTTLRCLGRTKHGHPRHPLYVKGDAPLERFCTPVGKGVYTHPNGVDSDHAAQETP